jgi:thiamine biosynthesis lipoprotein
LLQRFILFLMLLLVACNSRDKHNVSGFAGIAMTIPYRILIGKDLTFFEKKRIQSIIDDAFHHIDQTYNYWNPYSEISRLNQLKGLKKQKISAEMMSFLERTSQIVQLTEGRFDPTVRPLYQLWKTNMDKGYTPTSNEIEALLPAIGWKHIHYSEGFFWKDHDATSLDLGGIAKGYCVDLIAERLRSAGYENFYIEWGGEIFAGGKHPDDRPWRIYISKNGNPDVEEALAIVDLNDAAIATSGNYYQNWVVKTEAKTIKYTHIINPKTGYPLESDHRSITSASVEAPNCMLADALATALMMPSENLDWIEEIKKEYPTILYWLAF